jgi:hypothetical protein
MYTFVNCMVTLETSGPRRVVDPNLTLRVADEANYLTTSTSLQSTLLE